MVCYFTVFIERLMWSISFVAISLKWEYFSLTKKCNSAVVAHNWKQGKLNTKKLLGFLHAQGFGEKFCTWTSHVTYLCARLLLVIITLLWDYMAFIFFSLQTCQQGSCPDAYLWNCFPAWKTAQELECCFPESLRYATDAYPSNLQRCFLNFFFRKQNWIKGHINNNNKNFHRGLQGIKCAWINGPERMSCFALLLSIQGQTLLISSFSLIVLVWITLSFNRSWN